MSTPPFKVVVAGLGYFSQFHIDAWQAAPDAELVGLCDTNPDRLSAVSLVAVTQSVIR